MNKINKNIIVTDIQIKQIYSSVPCQCSKDMEHECFGCSASTFLNTKKWLKEFIKDREILSKVLKNISVEWSSFYQKEIHTWIKQNNGII